MERQEHTIDVTGKSMGRVASEIAILLRGKNKPSFERHTDCGDIVKIQNADKMVLTGNKMDDKLYHSYSGYPGGIKTRTAGQLMAKDPGKLLQECVRKMLPATRLRSGQLKRLIIE